MTRSRRLVHFLVRHLAALLGLALFVVTFLTYASTVPPVQVFGDPSEYTFIPWILGIAHPPGYGFLYFIGRAWQRLVPIGSVAFRTHLLAATAGALSATLVYLIVLRLINRLSVPSGATRRKRTRSTIPRVALLAGTVCGALARRCDRYLAAQHSH